METPKTIRFEKPNNLDGLNKKINNFKETLRELKNGDYEIDYESDEGFEEARMLLNDVIGTITDMESLKKKNPAVFDNEFLYLEDLKELLDDGMRKSDLFKKRMRK